MEYVLLGGLVGGLWAFLFWLSIVVWVYRDIRSRTRDLALQVLAVFLVLMFFPGFNIPGLALYLMLRPHETLDEAYARSLEEEALLREMGDEGICPSCRRFTERTWRFCPFCQTQLKDLCGACGQLLSFNWVVCPDCGAQRKGAGAQPEEFAPARASSARRRPPTAMPQPAAPQQDEETEPAESISPYQQ